MKEKSVECCVHSHPVVQPEALVHCAHGALAFAASSTSRGLAACVTVVAPVEPIGPKRMLEKVTCEEAAVFSISDGTPEVLEQVPRREPGPPVGG